jgi:hypothetical protein
VREPPLSTWIPSQGSRNSALHFEIAEAKILKSNIQLAFQQDARIIKSVASSKLFILWPAPKAQAAAYSSSVDTRKIPSLQLPIIIVDENVWVAK